MAVTNPFTPGTSAVVTAGSAAASLTLPAGATAGGRQVQIQVAAGANAAFSLNGTAVAPDGTPNANKHAILGGNSVIWTLPVVCTAISYIRVGGSDATVYFTFGDGL